MIDLSSVLSEYSEDIESVNEFASDIYSKYFSCYFDEERKLYDRLKCKDNPVTDEELEWILTSVPLELFSVSEQLSQFQLSEEVIKLKIKQDERDKVLSSDLSSETKRKEEAAYQMLEHKLFLAIYDKVTDRVSREISFSRELIMSAKKIWDARRRTDSVNPINPVNVEDSLPGYEMNIKHTGPKSYIG